MENRFGNTSTIVAFMVWAAALAVCHFYNVGLFRLINGHYTGFGDHFFSLATCLGDGLVLGIFLFLLWPSSPVHTLLGLGSLIVSGIIVQILKNYLAVPRPLAVLELVHLVGAKHYKSSFPSGHTASAFAVGYLFCSYYTRRSWKALVVFLAVLVGYSRVYIGVHFPMDVVAGAGIGVFCTKFALTYKRVVLEWFNTVSDRRCRQLYRLMMGVLAGGGLFLLFFYTQLPIRNIWFGNLLGCSAFVAGLFFLWKRRDQDNPLFI